MTVIDSNEQSGQLEGGRRRPAGRLVRRKEVQNSAATPPNPRRLTCVPFENICIHIICLYQADISPGDRYLQHKRRHQQKK